MRWRTINSVALLVGLSLLIDSQWTRADDEPGPIDVAEVPLERPADFRRDVLPILRTKCLACHSASKAEGGLVLESPESIRKGGDSGPAVVAGNPDESLLALSAGRRGDPSAMPPLPNDSNATPLTPQELGLLTLWIREGARDAAESQRMIAWQPLPGQIDAVYSLALDSTEQLVAAGRGNRIHLYDLVRQRELAVLRDPALSGDEASIAHRDVISSVAFSPDGNWLASGGYRIVKLWQRLAPLQDRWATQSVVASLAVSVDGRWVAVGLDDGSLLLRDRTAHDEEAARRAHDTAVTELTFVGDGSRLVTAAGPELKLWDVSSDVATGQLTTPAPIRAIRTVSDGARIATGHDDGVIRIWALEQLTSPPGDAGSESAMPQMVLTGHSKPVTSLTCATTDEPRLVSASDDGTVRLWDPERPNEVGQFAHSSPVAALAVTADGKTIASGGPDGLVRIWDLAGKQIAQVSGDPRPARELARRQQDQQVAKARKAVADTAVTEAKKDLKEREDSLAKAMDQVTAAETSVNEAQSKVDAAQNAVDQAAASLTEMPEDESRKKAVTDAQATLKKEQEALTSAGDTLASARRGVELSEKSVAAIKASLEAHQVRLEAEVAAETAADAAVKTAEVESKLPAAAVSGLAFAPDGSWLAVADEAGRIVLWHVETQAALAVLSHNDSDAANNALCVTSNGQLLSATADGHVDTWNNEPGFSLVGVLGPSDETGLNVGDSPIDDRVLALDFGPDSKLLAVGSGVPSRSGQLQLWDVAARALVRTMPDAHSDTVFSVAFTRDGTLLASGAADKFAKVFNVATGQLQRSFEGHTGHVLSVAWKADGSVLATGGADNAIKTWTSTTGEQQRTITSHTKPVNAIAFVGIEEKLVSASGDTAVLLHTISNGRNYRRLSGAGDFLHAVAVSNDESRVIAGCEDGIVRVWNGSDGKLLMSFPTQ